MVPDFVGVFSVKAGKALINHCIRMIYLLRGGVTIGFVRVFVMYSRFLSGLFKKTSIKFVAKYLKTAQIMLMQSVSGQKDRYPSQLFGAAVSCTSSGLPRVIPKAHRAHIRNGSKFHVRLWITLFGLYRVLEFPGVPTIKTIVTPGVQVSNSFVGELLVTIEEFIQYHKLVYNQGLFKAWSILSVSPTSPSVGKVTDNELLKGKFPAGHLFTLLNSLRALRYVGGFGWEKSFKGFLVHGAKLANVVEAPGLARLFASLGPLTAFLEKCNLGSSNVGKLAYKQEPAGKLRVFAMLDPFSQWILKPIHDGIFGMLRLIRHDATFNQLESVKSFTDELRLRKIKEVYSFDLTAATDRLPVNLQTVLISYFIGDQAASAWIEFLTTRWFALPSVHRKERLTSVKQLGVSTPNPYILTSIAHVSSQIPGKFHEAAFEQVTHVRYAAGQPMGAYSSWAMLALFHHLIVFMAWRRSGYEGPLLYLVLGDDVVIANSSIAGNYLSLLDEIGSPINLSKSIVSTNGSFEFAKRFICAYDDVSPISWKEMFVARWDINSLVSLASNNGVKLSSILLFLDHGYKAVSRLTAPLNEMSRSMALTLLWFSRPGSYLSKIDSFSKWIYTSSFNVFHIPLLEMKPLIKWGQQLAMQVLRSLKSPSHYLSEYALQKDILKHVTAFNNEALEPHVMALIPWISSMLWASVFSFYRDSMVYDYNAARGTIQRSIMTMKGSAKLAEKSLSALDEVFATVFESEKEVSSFDTINLAEWRVVDKITTLNRCRDLKWALYLRNTQPKLTIVKPARSLRKGFRGII
jgi:hypothetical protein